MSRIKRQERMKEEKKNIKCLRYFHVDCGEYFCRLAMLFFLLIKCAKSKINVSFCNCQENIIRKKLIKFLELLSKYL